MVTTNSAPDVWGNVTHIEVDSGGGYRKISDNTYGATDEEKRLGRLTAATVVHQATGTPTITRGSGWEYSATNCKLSKEIVEPTHAGDAAITTYEDPDSYGNNQLVKTTGNDVAEDGTAKLRVSASRTTFDSRGRFAVKTRSYLSSYTGPNTAPFWRPA